MSIPNDEKTAEWMHKEQDIRSQRLDPWTEEQALGAALGSEYNTYQQWTIESTMPAQLAFFNSIAPDEFNRRLEAIDYNKNTGPKSIHEFAMFLDRPNFEDIIIGKMGDVAILLAPESCSLEARYDQQGGMLPDVDDTRMLMYFAVLGMWTSAENYRAGQYSDEGYGPEGSMQAQSTQEFSGLECFHQLGLLYARGREQELNGDADGENGWKNSNYVLVRNVDDDSIWVLWRKYIYYPETNIYGLAKDMLPYDYAIFPGLNDETVICGQIAESWSALERGMGTQLRLRHVLRAESAGKPIEEPLLVSARRAAEGGMRRENDFRSKGPRT